MIDIPFEREREGGWEVGIPFEETWPSVRRGKLQY